MHTPFSWIREQWPCISSAGFIGFFIGALFTRRLMAPSFCPGCLRQQDWLREFKKEKAADKAAESRLYYRIRKKDKQEPPQ